MELVGHVKIDGYKHTRTQRWTVSNRQTENLSIKDKVIIVYSTDIEAASGVEREDRIGE